MLMSDALMELARHCGHSLEVFRWECINDRTNAATAAPIISALSFLQALSTLLITQSRWEATYYWTLIGELLDVLVTADQLQRVVLPGIMSILNREEADHALFVSELAHLDKHQYLAIPECWWETLVLDGGSQQAVKKNAC